MYKSVNISVPLSTDFVNSARQEMISTLVTPRKRFFVPSILALLVPDHSLLAINAGDPNSAEAAFQQHMKSTYPSLLPIYFVWATPSGNDFEVCT